MWRDPMHDKPRSDAGFFLPAAAVRRWAYPAAARRRWFLMLESHDREKLINAAIYFAEHTRHCGKIKLIKLLYLLDFEHYRQTGAPVTGMEYRAMKMGPVPMELYQEWDALEPDFADDIDIVPLQVVDFVRESVRPLRAFDDSHFTRRELRLMHELATRFRDDFSKPMIGVTHEERGPWAAIWDNGRGNLERIPFALAIREEDSHAALVREAATEYEGIRLAQGH
ncbi:MAG: SocA family protein [Xanthomonadales bacterium]|nr:SocA family protein [Xanthomonadales bacterium]